MTNTHAKQLYCIKYYIGPICDKEHVISCCVGFYSTRPRAHIYIYICVLLDKVYTCDMLPGADPENLKMLRLDVRLCP